MTESQLQKCGFVAVLGIPNVGKSTLVNALVGSKVSIVSHKVQTTRRRVLGIAMHEQSQIVLMDTPGIFTPQKRLDRAMVGIAWDSMREADFIIVMVDASAPSQTATKAILKKLGHTETPILVVMNKIDRISREKLLPLTQEYATEFPAISRFFMVSAQTKSGLQDLLNFLATNMPVGPWMFPADQLTDLPMRLWAAELTREKIYLFLHEELPYAINVETEKWENFDNGDVKIMQTIHVERSNQKSIVLGKGGQMLKRLGETTRKELQEALERKVHLILNVRVTSDWSEDPAYYESQGLERPKN
jgi:GTP-binding protein Era